MKKKLGINKLKMKPRYLIAGLIFLGLISIPTRYYIDNKHKVSDKIVLTSFKKATPPKSVQMFLALVKFAEKYSIPKNYAFGIAYYETGFIGPMQFEYNPCLESPFGAIGAMQIMPGTAQLVWKKNISRSKLLNDIEFNVETSMVLLSTLYAQYKDWKIVFGCYNTGQPIINCYAENVYNFKLEKI